MAYVSSTDAFATAGQVARSLVGQDTADVYFPPYSNIAKPRRPARMRQKVSFHPETLDRFKVEILVRAREGMGEEIFRHNDSLAYPARGLETGGYLGGVWPEPDCFRLTRASAHNGDAIRGPDSLRFHPDDEEIYEFERGLLPEHRLCGHWHVHRTVDSAVPSPSDLAVWAQQAERFGRTNWVGVIATPTVPFGWSETAFTPWVVHLQTKGRPPLCRPARTE